MGCISQKNSSSQSQEKIKIKLKRSKHEINNKIDSLEAQRSRQQKLLVTEYKKPRSNRVVDAETCMAGQITKKANLIEIYRIDQFHVERIDQYSHLLSSKNKKKCEETLFPSFRILLYSQSILKDQQIDELCRMITKKYPHLKQADGSEVESEVMRNYKSNDLPTSSMTNDYVLQLCSDRGLDLAEINSVGHNYRYGG